MQHCWNWLGWCHARVRELEGKRERGVGVGGSSTIDREPLEGSESTKCSTQVLHSSSVCKWEKGHAWLVKKHKNRALSSSPLLSHVCSSPVVMNKRRVHNIWKYANCAPFGRFTLKSGSLLLVCLVLILANYEMRSNWSGPATAPVLSRCSSKSPINNLLHMTMSSVTSLKTNLKWSISEMVHLYWVLEKRKSDRLLTGPAHSKHRGLIVIPAHSLSTCVGFSQRPLTQPQSYTEIRST